MAGEGSVVIVLVENDGTLRNQSKASVGVKTSERLLGLVVGHLRPILFTRHIDEHAFVEGSTGAGQLRFLGNELAGGDTKGQRLALFLILPCGFPTCAFLQKDCIGLYR